MAESVSIPVRVGLSESSVKEFLPDPDIAKPWEPVEAYLRDLIKDLRIPAKIDFKGETVAVPAGLPFLLSIGVNSARVERSHEPHFSVELLLREIYRNRHLFITEQVAQAFVATVMKTASPTPSAVQRAQTLLWELAWRNLQIDRLGNEHLSNASAKVSDILFEICKDEEVQVKVFLEPRQFKKISEPPEPSNGASGPPAPPWQAISDRVPDKLFGDLGLVYPAPELSREYGLTPGTYRIVLNDVGLPLHTVPPEIDFLESLERRLDVELRAAASSFLTSSAVERQLDLMLETSPALVTSVKEQLDAGFIFELLQSLIEEEVSIKDFRRSLDALASIEGTCSPDPSMYIIFRSYAGSPLWVEKGRPRGDLRLDDYVQQVRAAHKAYFSDKYSLLSKKSSEQGGLINMSRTMQAFLLRTEIEDRLRDAAAVPLTQAERERLINAILDAISAAAFSGPPIIMTTEDVRKTLWKLVCCEIPQLVVLSYQELSPDLNITPLSHISV